MSQENQGTKFDFEIQDIHSTNQSIQVNKRQLLEKIERLSQKLGAGEHFALRPSQKPLEIKFKVEVEPPIQHHSLIYDELDSTVSDNTPKPSPSRPSLSRPYYYQHTKPRIPMGRQKPTTQMNPMDTVQQVLTRIRSSVAKCNSLRQQNIKTEKQIQSVQHRLRQITRRLQGV